MSKLFSPPFTLNKNDKDDDVFLLNCLKGDLTFSFLSKECRKTIGQLRLSRGKNFRSLHKSFLGLFPLVLTDALRELKKHDPREYNAKNKGMGTFFDPASLGITELMEVVNGFADFEGLLYGASPDRYRDHIVHSFRVWIIGHGILEKCFNGQLASPSFIKVKKNEWMCMWAIIALCHDIGYPLSHIEKINERARTTLKKQGLLHEGDLRFTFSQQMLPFHDTIIKILAAEPVKKGKNYYTHLQNKYYLKLFKSFDKLDHGIISSLLISRALVYFLESDFTHDTIKPLDRDDVKQFFIRREILRSIAAHTCQDIYHLTFNNLSILLYLVDEIQCWGRPTLEQTQHEAFDIEDGSAEIKQFSETCIDIRITTNDKKWDLQQQKGVSSRILKLKKMLRLALGRRNYVGNEMIFEVCNQGTQKIRLEMKGKSLKLHPKGFNSTLAKEISN